MKKKKLKKLLRRYNSQRAMILWHEAMHKAIEDMLDLQKQTSINVYGDDITLTDIFDDLTPAKPDIQRAAYEIILGRCIDEDESELIWSGWRTWNRRD